MIVALPKPGDEGYDEAHKQMVHAPPRTKRGVIVSAAFHAPIAHVLGKPCIYFAPKPEWAHYPLVHERNVIAILRHESVHCAMMRVLGVEREDAQRGFDRLFGGVFDI